MLRIIATSMSWVFLDDIPTKHLGIPMLLQKKMVSMPSKNGGDAGKNYWTVKGADKKGESDAEYLFDIHQQSKSSWG